MTTPWKNNYHIHTTYCDGVEKPGLFVQKAVDMGFEHIGFSSHAPVPFATGWNMTPGELDIYVEEIKGLREKYSHQIEILIGLEVDYIPGFQGPSTFKGKGLDYTIGSVHYLFIEGKYRELDYNPEQFEFIAKNGFGGDIPAMITAYFSSVRGMLINDPPTILGHVDLVKKFNRQHKFFDENAHWYLLEVEKTAEVLSRTRTILEVNTAPVYRDLGDEPYPSTPLLKIFRKYNIPIVLNSDAHSPDCLAGAYPEGLQMIINCGYKTLHEITLTGVTEKPIP